MCTNNPKENGDNDLQKKEPATMVRYMKNPYGAYEKIEFYSCTEQQNGRPKLIRYQLKRQMSYWTDDIARCVNKFNQEISENKEEIKLLLLRKLQMDDLTQLDSLLEVTSAEPMGFDIEPYTNKKKKTSGYEFKFYNRKQKCGINENEVIINLHLEQRNNGYNTSILDFFRSAKFHFPYLSVLQKMKKWNYNNQETYNEFKIKAENAERHTRDCNFNRIQRRIVECEQLIL